MRRVVTLLTVLLVAVLVMAGIAPALANECPVDMKEIDEALAKKPELSAANLEKVKKLRAEGEALHKAGKHAESLKALDQAKTLLGI